MKKPLIIAIFILGIFAAALFVLYSRAPRQAGTGEGASVITYVSPTQVPKPLGELMGLNKVKPYNVEEKTMQHGISQSLTFDTAHLKENYEIIKKNMVEENKFSLQTDDFNSGGFDLIFKKGDDRLEAIGFLKPQSDSQENSSIMVTFYRTEAGYGSESGE